MEDSLTGLAHYTVTTLDISKVNLQELESNSGNNILKESEPAISLFFPKARKGILAPLP
jgi:hypothetical protein